MPDPLQGRTLLVERRQKVVAELDKAFEQQDQQSRKSPAKGR